MLEWTNWPGTLALELGLLVAAGIVTTFYFAARKRASGWRLVVLILLRLALVAGILICLLDPHMVHEKRIAQSRRLMVLVDTSRSMLTREGPLTRLERAQKWWQLQKHFEPEPELMGFDEKLHPLKSDESWTATQQGGTSLATALRLAAVQPSGTAIGGIILVSDGRVTGGESPLAAARGLAAQDIPVSTLTIGQDNPTPTLQIQAISAPSLTAPETPMKAIVSIQAAQLKGESGTVRLKSGGTVLAQREVMLTGDVQNVEVNFQLHADPTLQICEAELDLTTPRAGLKPDVLPFAIRVADSKMRVLYMEGTGQMEILYLQRSLQLDPQIKVALLTPGQPVINSDEQTMIANVQDPVHGYPHTMEEMLQYDVIIISDIRKELFTDDQLKMTERFVEEFGGGFVMVGGDGSFGMGGYNFTAIDKIIPVAMDKEKSKIEEGGCVMNPTPQGLNHPIMSLGSTPEETRKIWQNKRPWFGGYNTVDRAKPGATVLAEVSNKNDENGPFVLLAAQDVGNGRSMAFTSDTTINWGAMFERNWGEPIDTRRPLSEANSDHCYYRKFWNNAIRWLAAKRLAQKSAAIVIESSKRRVNVEESFDLLVRWKGALSSGSTATVQPDTVGLQVTDLGSNEVLQKLSLPLKTGTKDYAGKLKLTHPGRYLIDLQSAGNLPATCAPAIVTCDTIDPELADTRADPALMAQVARLTGGQVLSENSTDELRVASQRNSTAGHMEYSQESLWDRGWVLATLATLLITEWFLRRRWSLT